MNIPKELDELLDSDFFPVPEVEDPDTKLLAKYEGADPRLKLLSHSSRLVLHTCPRKFQLYRLNSIDTDQEDINSDITFAYGTVVGIGVQCILEGKSEQETILAMFLAWDIDLYAENPRQKKSFFEAIFAVQRFAIIAELGIHDHYELVQYNGTPAVELSFEIILPNGFSYRGYVDAVLRHKYTGEVIVLECKTSSYEPNSSNYKNSGQALGYSVVLDKLFPELSSYSVLYLVYHSKAREFTQFNFPKNLLQRALWLQELLLDTQIISLYEEYETYPMYGESCYNYFRDCEYLGLCTMLTERLTKKLTVAEHKAIKEKKYDFVVDFYDLVASQLEKGV